MTSITDINTHTTKDDLKRIEARIDEYIDMGHFSDPHKARPYLIEGALSGYEMAKAEARLTNTIITQLQRAHKASDKIKDQQITELTRKLEWLIHHAWMSSAISKAKAAELLGCTLIDFDEKISAVIKELE